MKGELLRSFTPSLRAVVLGGTQGAIFPFSLSLNTRMLESTTYTTHIWANVPKWNLSFQENPPLSVVHPVLCRPRLVLLNLRQDQHQSCQVRLSSARAISRFLRPTSALIVPHTRSHQPQLQYLQTSLIFKTQPASKHRHTSHHTTTHSNLQI